MVPTKLSFEQMYSDGYDVEFAVRYNRAELLGQIVIMHVDSACFPIDKLDWLIDCLQIIKRECVATPNDQGNRLAEGESSE